MDDQMLKEYTLILGKMKITEAHAHRLDFIQQNIDYLCSILEIKKACDRMDEKREEIINDKYNDMNHDLITQIWLDVIHEVVKKVQLILGIDNQD